MDADVTGSGPFTVMYDVASWPDQEEPALGKFQVHPPTTCRACASLPTRGVVCGTDLGDDHYDIRVVEPICAEDGHASRRAFSIAFVVAGDEWQRVSVRRVLPEPSSPQADQPAYGSVSVTDADSVTSPRSPSRTPARPKTQT